MAKSIKKAPRRTRHTTAPSVASRLLGLLAPREGGSFCHWCAYAEVDHRVVHTADPLEGSGFVKVCPTATFNGGLK